MLAPLLASAQGYAGPQDTYPYALSQEPADAPASIPNYLALGAAMENYDGLARLLYRCDFQWYDYAGAPVAVYLMAVEDPAFSGGSALSLGDLLAGGEVRVFRSDMSAYLFSGALGAPTFIFPRFPSGQVQGSFPIDTVTAGIYRGTYAFAAVFIRADTRQFVRTDGFPAAGSGAFTPFRYHADVLTRTIHVGDGYDPYMANWEVPYPMGLRINAGFPMDHVPAGIAVLRGGFWGTYYRNPVYLNGSLFGIIPSLMNGNKWAWASARVPPRRFRAGTNVMTFGCDVNPLDGHWDNYMAKDWEIYYN
ncbi:MAG: hypothetical protein WCP22_09635 [Chlamydiota bacterium]